MNVSSPRELASSPRKPSLLRRLAPMVAAVLVALPMAASAHGHWAVGIGFGPVYPAYPVYQYPVYPAYPYAVYPAYPAYPAYPVYRGYWREGYAYDDPDRYRTETRYRTQTRTYAREREATDTTATATTTYDSAKAPPPPLPVEQQPPIPGDGYIWTPGYWAYGADGYFWVAGTWVLPPYAGALWTPAYWGWNDGYYAFYPGYWGLHVGFYGGINYGFGYFGVGYLGGYWHDHAFVYNRAVNNFGTAHVRNAYNLSVVNYLANRGARTSFNGGTGGIKAKPIALEQVAAHDRHHQPVAAQQRQLQSASRNRAMSAAFNHGTPPLAATRQAGVARANNASRQARAATQQAGHGMPVNARESAAVAFNQHRSMLARARAPRYAERAHEEFGARPSPASRMPAYREYAQGSWRGPAQSGREVGAPRFIAQPHPSQHASGPVGRYNEKSPR